MAKKTISRSGLTHMASAGALALAAAGLTLPGIASAQDGGQRGEWRGGQGRGDGGGGERFQNRGDRMAQMQQAPQQQRAQQAPPAVQQQAPAPRADRGQRYQGQAQAQAYRGRGDGGDQRGWTDAQREAYRGAVLEGRATDQFQNRGGDRSTWQTDRQGYRSGDGRGPGQPQGTRNDDRRGDRNGWGGDRDRNGWNGRQDRNGWQDNRSGTYAHDAWRNNGDRNNRSWDRGWRSNNRYNWSSYRSSNRNVFSAGSYYSPYRGYSYRRLGIGFSLNSLFYGSRYWINDPYQYRLPEAYGPYRWVRYYDDVLLVDTYTGEVVDAIYDFFY